jgi:hypothetical protein
MEGNTKQTRAREDNRLASTGLRIEMDRHKSAPTYWGILCRTCRDLVAFDISPYVSFGPDAASMNPGAIRCDRGHNHIYFPRDFGFVSVAVPISDAVMLENREAYRAVNPPALTSYNRPVVTVAATEMNHQHSIGKSEPDAGKAAPASIGTYLLLAKSSPISGGEFKGRLGGIAFTAISPTETMHWFAINCGQFERAFCKLVPQQLAIEIVDTLSRGQDVEFPGRYLREQLGSGFHYEWSPVLPGLPWPLSNGPAEGEVST